MSEQEQPAEIWEQIWDAPPAPQKREFQPPSWTSARELLAKDLPPPEWIVPGLLPEGLTILAARPKIGKSWLAMNFGICISHRLPVLGSIEAPPGDVLYLALEDTERRLKFRYSMIVEGLTMGDGPDHFTFGVEALRINDGLTDQIKWWLSTVENPRLVIVDTLSKVRPVRRGEGDSYSESYIDMAALKEVADREGIGMMVIHHTRKATAEDALEEVMGSTGFTGAADTIFVLKKRRGDYNATLLITGRDNEDIAIELTFDPDRGVWSQEGVSKIASDSTQGRVYEYLAIHEGSYSPDTIATAIGVSRDGVRMALRRLMDSGRVERIGRGQHRVVTADVYDEGDEEE